MTQFRKKPVVIDAVQTQAPASGDGLLGAFIGDPPAWLLKAIEDRKVRYSPPTHDQDPGTVVIETLEGALKVTFGDWLIQGIQGEIYPCKPDIFAATYDAV